MKDFTQLADLASERLGGRVIVANDEFFAPKENLLKESRPVFIEGKYTDRGKWMDGWETRRRRTPGYDWCIVRLGLPGTIHGIVVDTSFFKGNYPEQFSLEACRLSGRLTSTKERQCLQAPEARWTELFPRTGLKGDSQNAFPLALGGCFSHVRLKIYPDGGVARLRVHGIAVPGLKENSRKEIDLVGVGNGGSVVASSDQFFGAPRNLLLPGFAKNMGDGWETRRRRGPGHDWVILKLGMPGTIRRVEVDTSYFRGNFPESCSLEACLAKDPDADASELELQSWKELLPRTLLKASHRHHLNQLREIGKVTHVRFNIYPDGGVARLRAFGRAEARKESGASIESLNSLTRAAAKKTLLDCCGGKEWAERMVKEMPFSNSAQLLEIADKVWADLRPEDWLEAFRHHPPIGGKKAKAKQSATARKWSAREQSVAQSASQETLSALAAANQEYQAKFGHIFLICAAGKSSDEILNSLRQRVSNAPETELRVAAEEQRKITRLRLEKLLAS